MKVIICLNTAWNLFNFRSGLIKTLVAEGHEVVAVAPYDSYASRLDALGCRFLPLAMDTHGTHPGRDAMLLFRYIRLLKQEKPDVYLGYTIKPNVYGSLAAHWLGIPVINNIAGLGAVFIKGNWLAFFVRLLYRMALKQSLKVFFQNSEDQHLFIQWGLVRPATTDLLPGSGIDLNRFSPTPVTVPAGEKRKFRFLLIARMLRDKGVFEFVEAAKAIRQRQPQTECCLLGAVDEQNPNAVSRMVFEEWVTNGWVNYLGVSEDVRAEIANADCVVLPSYREGTPRTLLEACAMGRPVIATDVVGCREVVIDGLNGYLCEVRDAEDLANKMEQMVLLSEAERMEMGFQGRIKMEREFDERLVIDKYMAAIEYARSIEK